MRLAKGKTEKRSIAQTRLGVPSLKLVTVASHHPGYVAQRCEENKDDFHMVGGADQRQGSRRPQPMYLASQACRKGWTCPRPPSPQHLINEQGIEVMGNGRAYSEAWGSCPVLAISERKRKKFRRITN